MSLSVQPEVAYAREHLDDALIREIAPLMSAHWAEIGQYRDIPLNPDWDAYRACERVGALRAFLARDHGELVGYAAFIVRHDLKYKQSLQATGSGIYLSPGARGKAVGSALIRYADDSLRAEGVQVVHHFVSDKCDYSRTLERLGYVLVEKVYGRRLDA